MKNHLPFIVLFFAATKIFAQFDSLNINNVNAGISNSGIFFSGNKLINAGFRCPINSNTFSVFASSFWLSAKDASNSLLLVATRYNAKEEYASGPVSDFYDAQYDSLYFKVWKISKNEIDNHIQNWNVTGYSAPTSIALWPGNGRVQYGESPIVAPFVDLNQNGIYEPMLGDHPKIRGDQAIFVILNDDRFIHQESGGNKLGIELKMLFYAFNDADPIIRNTVFIHTEVTNRRGIELRELKVSNFVDLDLGNNADDYVGCDSMLNLFFGYNADTSDEAVNGGGGFGNTPFSMGIQSLCNSLNSFAYFNNEQSGPAKDPDNTFGYYNYQTCRWLDGTHFTYGGNGYGGVQNTCYLFSGDVTDNTQWSEASVPALKGDRRAVGTYDLGTLLPTQTKSIDLAYFLTID